MGWNWECAGGHVEQPLVLDLAVHLVILGRWVKGIILRHFYYLWPCGGVVAHVILVSAQVLLVLTLGLWTSDSGLTKTEESDLANLLCFVTMSPLMVVLNSLSPFKDVRLLLETTVHFVNVYTEYIYDTLVAY